MKLCEKIALVVNGFYILQTSILHRKAIVSKEMFTGMGKELPQITTIAQGYFPVVVILISVVLTSGIFLPALKDQEAKRHTLLITALVLVLALNAFIGHAISAPWFDMASGI